MRPRAMVISSVRPVIIRHRVYRWLVELIKNGCRANVREDRGEGATSLERLPGEYYCHHGENSY